MLFLIFQCNFHHKGSIFRYLSKLNPISRWFSVVKKTVVETPTIFWQSGIIPRPVKQCHHNTSWNTGPHSLHFWGYGGLWPVINIENGTIINCAESQFICMKFITTLPRGTAVVSHCFGTNGLNATKVAAHWGLFKFFSGISEFPLVN